MQAGSGPRRTASSHTRDVRDPTPQSRVTARCTRPLEGVRKLAAPTIVGSQHAPRSRGGIRVRTEAGRAGRGQASELSRDGLTTQGQVRAGDELRSRKASARKEEMDDVYDVNAQSNSRATR
jgi:hypothetical protein